MSQSRFVSAKTLLTATENNKAKAVGLTSNLLPAPSSPNSVRMDVMNSSKGRHAALRVSLYQNSELQGFQDETWSLHGVSRLTDTANNEAVRRSKWNHSSYVAS